MKKDPFEGEKGTIAREDKEAQSVREKEIILNEEMASLDLELTELKTLNLIDPDFTDILAELENSDNPSYRRNHKIYQALVDQSLLDDELLKEQEQANLRERHHNLNQIEEAKHSLKLLKKEEMSLKTGVGKMKMVESRIKKVKKAEEKKVTPDLLNSVQVNLKPYNFENEPKALNTKMKEYTEDLSHFTKKQEEYVSIKAVCENVKKEVKAKTKKKKKTQAVKEDGGGTDTFTSKSLRSKGPISFIGSTSTLHSGVVGKKRVINKKEEKREAVLA